MTDVTTKNFVEELLNKERQEKEQALEKERLKEVTLGNTFIEAVKIECRKNISSHRLEGIFAIVDREYPTVYGFVPYSRKCDAWRFGDIVDTKKYNRAKLKAFIEGGLKGLGFTHFVLEYEEIIETETDSTKVFLNRKATGRRSLAIFLSLEW